MHRMTEMLAALLLCGPAAAAGAAEQMVAANGTELAYVEAGSGSPVVFVHGAISDHRAWDPYREAIAARHHFIAYDQRYFGTRDWPDDGRNFSADTHAADLVAVAEALGGGPVGLVAWSYGGDVAARAAIARPDLFSAIVLYEPDVAGLIDGLAGASAAAEHVLAGFGPAIAAVEAGQLEDASLRFIEAVFALGEGGAEAEPEEWRNVWRENGRTIPPFLSAPAGDTATCADLSAVRVPILVVRGAQSTVYDVMMAERLAACAANALVLAMPDSNHDGPYRHPDLFAAMIGSFLDLAE
ncbi:alpha/beta fold hydrolase [Mangrovicoccus sp. HB161399]|uniref:alpha/beta fold hydrolase n=1 Tax=Mangrovicoccus sp. HB161399 TaxID=2720392 RepID=UPI00155191D2|nr:alpha/beta hydrolase [Mangrovicoccus sp. HB161399]